MCHALIPNVAVETVLWTLFNPLSQIHLSVHLPSSKQSPYNLYTPIPLWSLGIETLQRSSDLVKLK